MSAKLSKRDKQRIARKFPRDTGGILLAKRMVHASKKKYKRRKRVEADE